MAGTEHGETGVVNRHGGGGQRSSGVVMVQQQHELTGLVDETGGRAVVPRFEILRLGSVDYCLFANQRVVILDVKHTRRHLHTLALPGHGQRERDVFRHVQPVALCDDIEILIQPLCQQNSGIILGQAVAAERTYRRLVGDE